MVYLVGVLTNDRSGDFDVTTPPASGDQINTLTKRERECLELLAGGYRQKEIGRALQISERTVETHLRKVRERLGVADARAAVRAWAAFHQGTGIGAEPG